MNKTLIYGIDIPDLDFREISYMKEIFKKESFHFPNVTQVIHSFHAPVIDLWHFPSKGYTIETINKLGSKKILPRYSSDVHISKYVSFYLPRLLNYLDYLLNNVNNWFISDELNRSIVNMIIEKYNIIEENYSTFGL